jgi:uncharacterized Zn-binding protein involved in type VI secretion
MPEAARIGDTITHTKKLGGFLAGALLGAAVGVFVVATGGAGALVIAAAAATGASFGSQIGKVIGGRKKVPKGEIKTGAATVIIGGSHAARACVDTALCDDHSVKKIAVGSTTVVIEGSAAARIGDQGECAFEVGEGCPTVLIGGGQGMCPGLSIDSEVPGWMETASLVLGLVGAGGFMRAAGWGALRIGASLVGGEIGSRVGGHYGQQWGGTWGGVIGSLVGGAAGGALGAKLGNVRVGLRPAAPPSAPARALTAAEKELYSRPSGYRQGVRDKVWESAKGPDGNVRDPLTNRIMDKNEPWDMGHKPGYEFRKHQQSAAERGVDRRTFLDEHNTPDHYQPERPSSNRSHVGEDLTDSYLGP